MQLISSIELLARKIAQSGLRLILGWLNRLSPELLLSVARNTLATLDTTGRLGAVRNTLAILDTAGRLDVARNTLAMLDTAGRLDVARNTLAMLDTTGRLEVLGRLLEDRQVTTDPKPDLDAVINFSAYQRDAWVKLKSEMVKAGARVLDAGAGQCQYQGLFDHTDYKSQDFAQYVGSGQGPLQESWNYGKLDYVCDINAIPVPDGCFDVVLCTEVLEHVLDPLATIRELVRVLVPGGTLLITAPLGSGVHQEPHHYYGGFSPYFFRRIFGDLGVEPIEITPLGGLLKHVAQEVARAGRTLAGSGELNAEAGYVVNQWLPRRLAELDDRHFVEQFTVGFLVEGKKHG